MAWFGRLCDSADEVVGEGGDDKDAIALRSGIVMDNGIEDGIYAEDNE